MKLKEKIKQNIMKNKFNRIIKENSDDSWTRFDIEADNFERKGFHEEAIELYCKHAEAHVDNGWAYKMASRIAWSQGDYSKEKELLEKYANSYGNSEYGFRQLAEFETRTQNIDGTIQNYKNAGYNPQQIIWHLEKDFQKNKELRDAINGLWKEQIDEYKDELRDINFKAKNIRESISKLEEKLK